MEPSREFRHSGAASDAPGMRKQHREKMWPSVDKAYRVADSAMDLADWDSSVAAGKRERRQASTQTAYHLADSAPLKDYKPRGKTIVDKKTNIQAFY